VVTPVVHAYGHVGRTSWKKVAAHVDAALHARFETRSLDLQSAVPDGSSRVLVAQSGFALEPFVAATQRNGSRGRGFWYAAARRSTPCSRS
jgi:hypothetical protein